MKRYERLFPCLALLSAMAITGCGAKKTATVKSTVQPKATLQESEANTLAPLDTTPDLEHCRSALQQLDASDESLKGRPEEKPEDLRNLAAQLRLGDAERTELGQKTFTSSDALYLEQALLVRTAIRSLDVQGKPPVEQARLVFDWVCRMVYVNDRVPWPGPPGITMEAGQGVGLSRAYLLMAAWQQIGLTGCFIGPKSLGTTPAFLPGQSVGDKGVLAPVRVCGVKIGKDLYLFNHISGKPLTGKTPAAPLTWADLTANLELGKEVADIGQVSQWNVFLSFPAQAFTRRMKWLQDRDPGRIGVALSVDYAAQLAEFKKDVGEAIVDGWFLPREADKFGVSPQRVISKYASEDGKGSGPNRGSMARQEHMITSVPMEMLPQTGLGGLPLLSIRSEFATPFINLHFGQNSASHHLIRGQFKEGTTQLSDVRSMAEIARTRSEQDPALRANFQMWSQQLQSLIADVSRSTQRGDQAQEVAAKQNLDSFFKDQRNQEVQRAWVLGYASRPLLAESNYLLALSVHERTNRLQLKSAKPDPNAWKTVVDWWNRYLDSAAQTEGGFPKRDEQALRLKALAEGLAAGK